MADGKKANGNSGSKDDNSKNVVLKTAGLLVFTGIALGLFKALWPKKPLEESTEETVGGFKEEAKEKASKVTGFTKNFPWKKKSSVTIEIFKGDTLWELSQKYGELSEYLIGRILNILPRQNLKSTKQ